MTKIINWIKTNRAFTAFIVIFILTLIYLNPSDSTKNLMTSRTAPTSDYYAGETASPADIGSSKQIMPYAEESTDSSVPTYARKVVTESNVSLQVKNASESIDQIKNQAEKTGGFMISSNLSIPEESSTGQITVRVPLDKSTDFLNFLRQSAIKVVSENMTGSDITDQYTDNDAKLAVLINTKTKFEQILNNAVKIEDILRVQKEIINIQNQIDSIKGIQKNLDQTSATTRITVYLSTDEYSLPYAPDNNWRPNLVFKQAVRSLVLTVRGLADKIIWIAVYSIIWLPMATIIIYIYKRLSKNTSA